MRMTSAGRSREQDGIALVIVLGILSILLILGIAFATALRTDQIAGRNNIDFDTWMKLDLQYIDNWTLFLDVKLLLKTVPVVLLRRGAS